MIKIEIFANKNVKKYITVHTVSTCMIDIAHLRNVLILSHSSHFNNVTDHNVSKMLAGLAAIHT